jgi:hypothetical protein
LSSFSRTVDGKIERILLHKSIMSVGGMDKADIKSGSFFNRSGVIAATG